MNPSLGAEDIEGGRRTRNELFNVVVVGVLYFIDGRDASEEDSVLLASAPSTAILKSVDVGGKAQGCAVGHLDAETYRRCRRIAKFNCTG